jgi:inhibitor of cysteine peptidase
MAARARIRSLARMVALAGATWIGVSGALGGADAGKAAAMLSFSENDDGRTAEVRVGETVEVTLPENASTGYRLDGRPPRRRRRPTAFGGA